jgi:hypothetical protein
MANYQNVTPIRLGQAAITATYATLYTTPVNTRTYVKQMDVVNTTSGALSLYVHIVPTAGTATVANAIYYVYSIAANAVLQWSGIQVMNYGDTIQVKASGAGLTITASGGEAV